MKSVILVLMLLASGWLGIFVIKPARNDISILNARALELESALESANRLQAGYDRVLSKFNTLSEEDHTRLRKSLPAHIDNIRLLIDIEGIVSRYGLTPVGLTVNTVASKPKTPVATDLAPSNTAFARVPKPGATPVNGELQSLTTSFSVETDYATLTQLLSGFEQSLRVFDIIRLNVTPPSTSPAGNGLYKVDITLRTYWLE